MDNEYELKFDKVFSKEYRKLGQNLQKEGDKKIIKLKKDPENQGKLLIGFNKLYELHLQMYRIFYIVDKQEVKVLFIGLKHKDECDKYLRLLTKDKLNSLINENF